MGNVEYCVLGWQRVGGLLLACLLLKADHVRAAQGYGFWLQGLAPLAAGRSQLLVVRRVLTPLQTIAVTSPLR